MTLLWLFGWLLLAAPFAAWIWFRVALRNGAPVSTRNAVLMNAIGVSGVAGSLAYLVTFRVIDMLLVGVRYGGVLLPTGFLAGMVSLDLFLTCLVWTGSLRREDFMRLDSPTTVARSWWVFVFLLAAWSLACGIVGRVPAF